MFRMQRLEVHHPFSSPPDKPSLYWVDSCLSFQTLLRRCSPQGLLCPLAPVLSPVYFSPALWSHCLGTWIFLLCPCSAFSPQLPTQGSVLPPRRYRDFIHCWSFVASPHFLLKLDKLILHIIHTKAFVTIFVVIFAHFWILKQFGYTV